MTTPHGNPEAFRNNLLDSLEQLLEAEQDAPGLSEGDYIWKSPRPDRDGGGDGFREDG